jgi:hypothetical protein
LRITGLSSLTQLLWRDKKKKKFDRKNLFIVIGRKTKILGMGGPLVVGEERAYFIHSSPSKAVRAGTQAV